MSTATATTDTKTWVKLSDPNGSYRDVTKPNAHIIVSRVPKQLVNTPAVAKAIQQGRLIKIDAGEAKDLIEENRQAGLDAEQTNQAAKYLRQELSEADAANLAKATQAEVERRVQAEVSKMEAQIADRVERAVAAALERLSKPVETSVKANPDLAASGPTKK